MLNVNTVAKNGRGQLAKNRGGGNNLKSFMGFII